jgi:DNA-binding beta-propeller fold protein YncE
LQPYDGLVTPDGRYYLAGLFGEDGVALLDTWQPEQGSRRILQNYGRGEEKLPVFKMPHLRGWSMAQGNAYLPAIGRHEVLVVAGSNWQEVARIKVKGQPVFVMARPDGRQVWVNYAFPDNGWVEVIDTLSGQVIKTLAPGQGHPAHGIHAARRTGLDFRARRQPGRDLRHGDFRPSRRVSRAGAERHLLHQPRQPHGFLMEDATKRSIFAC